MECRLPKPGSFQSSQRNRHPRKDSAYERQGKRINGIFVRHVRDSPECWQALGGTSKRDEERRRREERGTGDHGSSKVERSEPEELKEFDEEEYEDED